MDQAQVSLPKNIMDQAQVSLPENAGLKVLDAFKKAPSPSGATISHL